MKVDPIHQQAMREVLVKLLRAYGVKKDLSLLDKLNKALIYSYVFLGFLAVVAALAWFCVDVLRITL